MAAVIQYRVATVPPQAYTQPLRANMGLFSVVSSVPAGWGANRVALHANISSGPCSLQLVELLWRVRFNNEMHMFLTIGSDPEGGGVLWEHVAAK